MIVQNEHIKNFSGLIFGFIILSFYISLSKFTSEKVHNKSQKNYLKSPWVTENFDWYFLSTPEKLEDFVIKKDSYETVCDEYKFKTMSIDNLFISVIYLDFKDNHYQNWDLRKRAKATINKFLYNLNCKEIEFQKQDDINGTEISYTAISKCNPFNYIAKNKSVRQKDKLLSLTIFYKENDSTLDKVSKRVINSLENKYSLIN
ncbi:hypothetical protein [Polaribacter marinivivus]|uniref:hypothetical protein n=1 Tax=Polaribacter marinivivus TaxID=1524260 RepID=UPI003D3449E6